MGQLIGRRDEVDLSRIKPPFAVFEANARSTRGSGWIIKQSVEAKIPSSVVWVVPVSPDFGKSS